MGNVIEKLSEIYKQYNATYVKIMGLAQLQKIRAERELVKPKKYYTIPKVSEKRKQRLKEQANSQENLDRWFEERRKEMIGKCFICGSETLKNDNENYRKSIHHLFEKRPNMFPSVALHPDNFLEVCYYGNSCHTNIHNNKITWQLLLDSKEGEIIIEKFKKIYPFIADNEKKYISEILLKFIE